MAESDELSNAFPRVWAVCGVSTWLVLRDKDQLSLLPRHVRIQRVWLMSHYVFFAKSQKFSPQNRQDLFVMIIMIVRAMMEPQSPPVTIFHFLLSSCISYFNVSQTAQLPRTVCTRRERRWPFPSEQRSALAFLMLNPLGSAMLWKRRGLLW